jgi:hypothetical protein
LRRHGGNIRQVIENNAEELRRYGTLHVRNALVERPQGGTVEVKEYWLDEGQTLLLFTKLKGDVPADARQEIITVFMPWRRGDLAPRGDSALVAALLAEMRRRRLLRWAVVNTARAL